MNTLKSQLAEFQASFKQRVAPERIAMMEAATAQLRDSGIEDKALLPTLNGNGQWALPIPATFVFNAAGK